MLVALKNVPPAFGNGKKQHHRGRQCFYLKFIGAPAIVWQRLCACVEDQYEVGHQEYDLHQCQRILRLITVESAIFFEISDFQFNSLAHWRKTNQGPLLQFFSSLALWAIIIHETVVSTKSNVLLLPLNAPHN